MIALLPLRIRDESARGRLRALEAWLGESPSEADPGLAEDLKAAAIMATQQAREIQEKWAEDSPQRAFCPDHQIFEYGSLWLRSIDHTLTFAKKLAAFAPMLAQSGTLVPQVSELAGSIRDLESIRAELLAAWPFLEGSWWPPLDPGQIGEARRAAERGEYDDLGDVIRELQGDPPPAG